MTKPGNDRASQAIAYQWASRVMTISLGMVVPVLLGYWLDRKFDISPVLILAGCALGMFLGFSQLTQIAKASNRHHTRNTSQGDGGCD